MVCSCFRASLESVCQTMKYQIMYRAMKGCMCFLIVTSFDIVYGWVLDDGYWVVGTGWWVLGGGYWMMGTGWWVLGDG
jgi:hypothetical protein